MPEDPDREPSVYTGLGQAMGLAAELVVTTLVGAGLGWLLSRWLGNAAVFLLVGTLLGGAAGVNRVYRSWKRQM
ncbi:MAG: AtpZ/AtpI family protein [Acidimicrobiia bacterium]